VQNNQQSEMIKSSKKRNIKLIQDEEMVYKSVSWYLRMPSNELEAKSTTPLAGLVNTPTRPLPTPTTFQQHLRNISAQQSQRHHWLVL